MSRYFLPFGLAALPALASFWGARGPLSLFLNLGPGDGPYLAGFLPDYEIDDRVATHWTTYDATIDLPLDVRGEAVLSFRYARVFPQTARVEVYVGSTRVDTFECRGGRFEERSVRTTLAVYEPLRVGFKVDSHDGRNMGLKLDWVRIDLLEGGSARLRGWSRFRAFAVVLFLSFFLAWAGFRWAPALVGLWALPATVGLLWNPWTTHQVSRGVPVTLCLLGLAVVGIGKLLRARDLPAVTALVLSAFLLRALAVNHPRFYYPDLRTHARLVETLQKAGFDFFRSPSRYIEEHGVWRTEAYGRTYAFPYTPGFHLPFVPIPMEYDSLLVALKLAAAAVSTVPLVIVWMLARRWECSVLGATLMIAIPTYTSRLSFAFLPALLGHAVDLTAIYWIVKHLDSLRGPRVLLTGALLVTACQLAYISGVVNMSLFLILLAAGEAVTLRTWKPALVILFMTAAGSLLSLAIYYRDFLPMVVDVLTRAGGAPARYEIQSWLSVAYERTRSFFDGVYPILAGAGVYLLARRRVARPVLFAWLATYFLLLLGRAKLPDIFLHGHETMFVTPLVALASGEALGWIRLRAVRYAVVLALFVQGFWLQWRFIADQLQNAM